MSILRPVFNTSLNQRWIGSLGVTMILLIIIISKVRDFDDWKVNPAIFQSLERAWGPFSVDCFASDYNCQLVHFHSKFCVLNMETVNISLVNWAGETCWLVHVPPSYLVGRALLHACKASGAIVVPLWNQQHFGHCSVWMVIIWTCGSCVSVPPWVSTYSLSPNTQLYD